MVEVGVALQVSFVFAYTATQKKVGAISEAQRVLVGSARRRSRLGAWSDRYIGFAHSKNLVPAVSYVDHSILLAHDTGRSGDWTG